MSNHLDQQLSQLSEQAPHFGRAAKDIEAIAQRARGQDYRGVLQNTRLVVETLLRAIVAKKKETPGKQTLEKLITKLQSDLPTHIQVHVRTIQAWGNVSSHDHSASLDQPGLEVGQDEALTAVSSLNVILSWYRGEHLADAPVPSIPSAPALSQPSAPASPVPDKQGGSKLPLFLGGVAVLAVAGVAVVAMKPGDEAGPEKPTQPETKAAMHPELVAAYEDQYEAVPPPECRVPVTHRTLMVQSLNNLKDGRPAGDRAADRVALEALEAKQADLSRYGEYWALFARAQLQTGGSPEKVLASIESGLQACRDLPSLHNLKGRLHAQAKDYAAAEKAFARAVALDSTYLAPKLNQALISTQQKDLPTAKKRFDALIRERSTLGEAYSGRGVVLLLKGDFQEALNDFQRARKIRPKDPQVFFLEGRALEGLQQADKAKERYCEAAKLGHRAAQKLCPEAS